MVTGKKALIIGAKKSGIAVARLLKNKGFTPFVSEIDDSNEIKEGTEKLKKLGIEYETGMHTVDKFNESDFIVLSPGVNINHLKGLILKDKPVYSEIEIAFRFLKNKFIAVTGSNGKTTTTALIAHLLNTVGINSKAVGNIGEPLSNHTEFDGILSVEISSFQLEHIEKFKPHTAVILNMTPDHLDRYQNIDEYFGYKSRIFENMDSGNFLIYNYDCSVTKLYSEKSNCKKQSFSIKSAITTAFYKNEHIFIGTEKLINKTEISIPGIHNIYNSMASILACLSVNANISKAKEGLKNFKGIPHRLEYLGMSNGVKYYNDSKSTNVDSLKYALMSFNNPVNLIAGGKDKMVDISTLNNLIESKVKNLILIGESAERFKKEWQGLTSGIYIVRSMDEAVKTARRTSEAGEIVLLSPACSSFDMYDNFEERGNHFKELVNKICFLH